MKIKKLGPKEWHIWDVPDNLYVLIEDEVREEFFKSMQSHFGSYNDYAAFLGKRWNNIQSYKYGYAWCRGKRITKSLPLWLLKKSAHLINKPLKKKIGRLIWNLQIILMIKPKSYLPYAVY